METIKRVVARLLFSTRFSYLNLAKDVENILGRKLASDLLSALRDALLPGATEFKRYLAAEKLSKAVYPKYKFSEFSRVFLDDKEFIRYYEKFMDTENWHSYDRKYTLNQLINLTLHLEGDLAECGVYKGATAYLMCQSNKGNNKTIHLFDSFQGLSTPQGCDGDYWKRGDMCSTRTVVEESLIGFSNYCIHEGWIPERLSDVTEKTFTFVHIDVDLYQPTLDAINFFYSRLAAGGVMLMDDYGFESCPGARIAADEFFRNKAEQIVMLSTGQGFVIKR